MRKILLATVAIAPLAIGAAWAQDAQPNNGNTERPRNMQTPAAAQSPGKSEAAQDKARANQAQGNADKDKEKDKARVNQAQGNADKDKARSAQDDKKGEPNRQAQGRDKDKNDANTGQAQTPQPRNDRSTAQGENSKNDQNAQDKRNEPNRNADKKDPAPATQGNANNNAQSPNRSNAAAPTDDKKTNAQAPADPNRNNAQNANRPADPNRSADQPKRTNADANRNTQDQNRTGANQTGQSNTTVNANANVNIEPEKQERVVNVLKDKREARTDVNFSVSVGVTVPTRVKFQPLPREVVEIVPQYRGYDYVVVRNEIVIVEPKTRKVVYVLNSNAQARAATRGKLTIASSKRPKIIAEARKVWKGPRDINVTLKIGEKVPQTVTLVDFPDMIITEEPELREYEFVLVGENVVIVDPDSREIVEIIKDL